MWQYMHSHLPGVPDVPTVAVEERRGVHIRPRAPKPGRTRPAAGLQREGGETGEANTRRQRRGADERERALAMRREQAEARRQQRERDRVVRERRRQVHEQVLLDAAEERRQRWVEQQLRAQRTAELLQHVEPREDAERRARRARLEQQRLCLQRIALRRAIRAKIELHDIGVDRLDIGSQRANRLVRRARYLFGRTDMIHWLRCHGQLAP